MIKFHCPHCDIKISDEPAAAGTLVSWLKQLTSGIAVLVYVLICGGLTHCKPSENITDSPQDPNKEYYNPDGNFDPEKAEKFYEDQLEKQAVAVFEFNRKYGDITARRSVLEEAVRNHLPGSEQALLELQRLKVEFSENSRNEYFKKFDNEIALLELKLSRIAEKQEKLKSKNSKKNEHEIVQLEEAASRVAFDLRLATELRRMLSSHIVSKSKSRTPQQMQDDFFPSYN